LRAHHEYVRKGICYLFVALEPKGGLARQKVDERRAKIDFVDYIRRLVNIVYKKETKISIALDNLNARFIKSFIAILRREESGKIA
jgi:hypothetical protein